MAQSLERIIGTRRWIPQLLGNWDEHEVIVHIAAKHELPQDVYTLIAKSWENRMRQVGQELGDEGRDWRIAESKPYSKLEIMRGGEWVVRMFAGEQSRIEDYYMENETLQLVHSPANYAESLATNNTDPWGFIRMYGGRKALADGHAVSVAITALDEKDHEVIQFFRRGKGLGEYGGYIGTAAGNSMRPELTPFDIAYREGAEESKILPFIGAYNASLHESGILANLPNTEDYQRLGISSSEFDLVEKLQGGSKVKYLDRRGNEASAILVSPETKYMMTGLALNIDPDDYDGTGENKPHHKSEYLFIARTKLPVEAINDPDFGWVRNDEHADVLYVPFNQNDLTEFSIESFQDMMPPTHAVTLSAIRNAYGHEPYTEALKATNAKYPITRDHPFVRVIESGNYTFPKLIMMPDTSAGF